MTIIKTLLTSKKFLVSLIAIAVWVFGRFGVQLDNEALLGAVGPLWAYVIAQGFADHGKETAKIRGDAFTTITSVDLAGIATSPTATSSPTTRSSEAGCARLHLMITLGLIATFALLASVACTSPTVRSVRHSVTQTVVDCGRAEVQDLAADLVPAVTAIVTGDTPSWRAQLDALLAAGVHAGACAIRTVGHDLATRAAQAVTGVHAEGQERVGAEHAAEYLQARGFVFEVQQ